MGCAGVTTFDSRGLRRSEALGLPWSDVDLERGTVTIREARVQVGRDVVTGDTKTDGSALVPDSASQRFDRLVVRAGPPPVRLHDLRHLAASPTYRATKDPKLTSQMPGHSSMAITEQVYTSVFEDVERKAAESAAALVPRAHRAPADADVPTSCPPVGRVGARGPASKDETAVQVRWGGWGSNPRPRDYECSRSVRCARAHRRSSSASVGLRILGSCANCSDDLNPFRRHGLQESRDVVAPGGQ